MVTEGLNAEEWRLKLLATLPPEEDVISRNRAITATYARWYMAARPLLKWAGAAAFASHRVGLALLPYEFIGHRGNFSGVRTLGKTDVGEPALFPDVNLLRETNNLVFADIGWAHAAYLSGGGGIRLIEEQLHHRAEYRRMLDGFREIERGRVLLEEHVRDRATAEKHIWLGNQLLLEHEQLVTVQAQFDKLDPAFRVFLSVTTSMDYDADNLRIDWKTRTSFRHYMWTRGLAFLARTASFPDIARADHRWFWVRNAVLRIWRRVDAHDLDLSRKTAAMIAAAHPVIAGE